MRSFFIIHLSTLVILVFAGSCASSRGYQSKSALDYSKSAEMLYNNGVFAFEKERWADAEKIFLDVGRKYPYSKFAPLSELRVADCHFNLGSHAEAAVEYQHFLKTYPTHGQAPYAAFKKAEAYYEQIPGEWFLTPPAHEKDQTATRDARAALASFIHKYSNSEYIPRARELYVEVESALVRHEMYVARFYLSREKRKAAAVRLESIGRQFPGSPLVPDAMFLQAITLLEMDRRRDADNIFNLIIKLYPENGQAYRAKQYLNALHLHAKRQEAENGN